MITPKPAYEVLSSQIENIIKEIDSWKLEKKEQTEDIQYFTLISRKEETTEGAEILFLPTQRVCVFPLFERTIIFKLICNSNFGYKEILSIIDSSDVVEINRMASLGLNSGATLEYNLESFLYDMKAYLNQKTTNQDEIDTVYKDAENIIHKTGSYGKAIEYIATHYKESKKEEMVKLYSLGYIPSRSTLYAWQVLKLLNRRLKENV